MKLLQMAVVWRVVVLVVLAFAGVVGVLALAESMNDKAEAQYDCIPRLDTSVPIVWAQDSVKGYDGWVDPTTGKLERKIIDLKLAPNQVAWVYSVQWVLRVRLERPMLAQMSAVLSTDPSYQSEWVRVSPYGLLNGEVVGMGNIIDFTHMAVNHHAEPNVWQGEIPAYIAAHTEQHDFSGAPLLVRSPTLTLAMMTDSLAYSVAGARVYYRKGSCI
ncbi:MAG: hypothetical protein HY535_01990 [Chloroflexi bacterium]|nr:hypothetical protein [Chloroflexota bacterium]